MKNRSSAIAVLVLLTLVYAFGNSRNSGTTLPNGTVKPRVLAPAPPAPPPSAAQALRAAVDRVEQAELERAERQLAGLPVTRERSMAGYSRDAFRHWRDPDHNGCDAREDTLIRDGANVRTGTGCKILSGSWFDPYGGQTYARPRQLDIDHLIPLAAAWRRGAGDWTAARRERFANDPTNLLAVYSSLNRQKGDKTIDQWQPPRAAFRCRYALLVIGVHSAYRLPLTVAEQAALRRTLETCPQDS